MNDFLGRLLRLLTSLVLLAVGLVVALSLAFAGLVLLAGWGLYAGWARLTGRPIVPFAMRMDPRAGFGRFYRAAAEKAAPASRTPRADANRSHVPNRRLGVTDVEAREPEGVKES
ncbi:hypothetical protein [Ramlibacter rhizophilus]|uniref:Uncharacterized protein n=1 Tax=Ramlibacter rhizophilus TaxID=1781167 RepID=A0A4Z0BKI2_9BURK|nr:hypothetical protein [Ramlibacter rhizophilus]TFY98777.1 hypothetical protein EZ242_14775 [Ramlibacter rhizophilus]